MKSIFREYDIRGIFKKELNELKTLQEKFIYFIKNSDNLTLIPKELEDISQALTTVNEATLTKEELELQHKRKEFISVQKSSIELAKEKGIEKGIVKGIEQRNIEIAKNLLDILDDETIALKTGLDIKVIQKLRWSKKNANS